MIERYAVARKNRQRLAAVFATLALGPNLVACSVAETKSEPTPTPEFASQCLPISRGAEGITISTPEVVCNLGSLAIKGRGPMTGYNRDEFGKSWTSHEGCNTRETILRRDLTDTIVDAKCRVQSGTLQDPYTGIETPFSDPDAISTKIDIDHVVALGDAWQKGAKQWLPDRRKEFANDGLNLLAVDASANRQKGDGDIATWEPRNKSRLCEYVARQVIVKDEYGLSVTDAEHKKMEDILSGCPDKTFVLAD